MTTRHPIAVSRYSLSCRRAFLGHAASGLGGWALAALSDCDLRASTAGALGGTHFPAKARRVIFLMMAGAPSQMDLFDFKPLMNRMHGQELPGSVRMGQRLTTMTSEQASFPLVGSPYKFARHGQTGTEVSELLPHTARIVDQLCIIRSMFTEPINHDPAVTFIQTGAQQPGNPCMGSWLSYGLGTENDDLPAFVVLVSGKTHGQPVLSRYWHSGFLPGEHQGVQFRSHGDAVLYLSNPRGGTRDDRRRIVDAVIELNRRKLAARGDPEIETRIESFELAFRMQASVPELVDLREESQKTLDMYGAVPGESSFAGNCLLARRLAERGVRFIQLYHKDWDHHQELPRKLPVLAKEIDQAAAALIIDLRQRGMLDETLVVWGGEFGRTIYCQGQLTADNFGRDHHPRCFTYWLAGGGVRPGITYGKTDAFSYNIVDSPVHVRDLHATILYCLGIDHRRLTYRHHGLEARLTGVEPAHVVREILNT